MSYRKVELSCAGTKRAKRLAPRIKKNSSATVSAAVIDRVSPAASVPQKTGTSWPKKETVPISVVLAGSYVSQAKRSDREPPPLSATVLVTSQERLMAGHQRPP